MSRLMRNPPNFQKNQKKTTTNIALAMRWPTDAVLSVTQTLLHSFQTSLNDSHLVRVAFYDASQAGWERCEP